MCIYNLYDSLFQLLLAYQIINDELLASWHSKSFVWQLEPVEESTPLVELPSFRSVDNLRDEYMLFSVLLEERIGSVLLPDSDPVDEFDVVVLVPLLMPSFPISSLILRIIRWISRFEGCRRAASVRLLNAE